VIVSLNSVVAEVESMMFALSVLILGF